METAMSNKAGYGNCSSFKLRVSRWDSLDKPVTVPAGYVCKLPLADLALSQWMIANAPGFASRDGKETC